MKVKTTGDIRIQSDEVDADWQEKWIALNDLVQWLESLGDNRIAVKMLETLKEDKEGRTMKLQNLKIEEVVRRLTEISNTSPTTISDILRNIGKMDMLIEVKAVLEKEED